MSSDFDDLEDDKSHVRSTLDALGDKLNKNGKPRGRPRKHPRDEPKIKKHKRDSSHEEESDEEEEEDLVEEEEPVEKKKRESDDEEWSEEQETLSISKRREMRVRKRPTLYSDEAAIQEAQRKRISIMKRGRPSKTPVRAHPVSPLVALPKAQQELVDLARRQLLDLDNPLEGKKRLLKLLMEGNFEQACTRVLPSPGPRPEGRLEPDLNETYEIWRKEIAAALSSAGFLEFTWNFDVSTVLVLFDVVNALFEPPPNAPDISVVQVVRLAWNLLPWSTRRKWERVARKRVMERAKLKMDDGDVVCAGHEVSIGHLTEARKKEEATWLHRRERGQLAAESEDAAVFCPLCDKDDANDSVRLGSMQQIQEHFFHAHWQVHGYACHFCGALYSTLEALKVEHTDCDEWMAYRAAALLAGGDVTGKIECTFGRMMLCCAECGWHVPLSMQPGALEMVKALMAHHHNDSLVTMIIYFPVKPSDLIDSVRFTVTPMSVKNPLLECTHCSPPKSFKDPTETDDHFKEYHSEMALKCGVCHARCATEFLFKQHQLNHVGQHTYLADFLSHSATIFPPPKNLSSAPVVGWKSKTNGQYALGGMVGGVGHQAPIDIVGPFEDCVQQKVRNLRSRKARGEEAFDDGFEQCEIEIETKEAMEIRKKLMKKYADCDGVGAIDDTCWFRPAAAEKFRKWMAYWESAEGKKKGGPPKDIVIDMSPSVVTLPTVVVEINFTQTMDDARRILLNDNVFYCMKCDVILKGTQAAEHLKSKDGEEENACAKQDDGTIEERPFNNENLYTLYVYAPGSPVVHCPALLCPHCTTPCCSIAGLQLHMLQNHSTYVPYDPIAPPQQHPAIADASRGLKFDLRTPLGKLIDAHLGMPLCGVYTMKPAAFIKTASIGDNTWPLMMTTYENTPAEQINGWRSLLRDLTVMPLQVQKTTPTRMVITPHIHTVPTARPLQQLQQQSRAAQFAQNAMAQGQRGMSYGDRMQQQRSIPQGRGGSTINHHLSPLQRALNRPVGVAQPVPQLHQQQVVQQQQAQQYARRDTSQNNPRMVRLMGYAMRERTRIFKCNVCADETVFESIECFVAHIMRRHFYSCGHCTAFFVYDYECRQHNKICKASQTPEQRAQPDARHPYVKARCPFCAHESLMGELPIHLMDRHLDRIEFELPKGLVHPAISLLPDQRPPSIQNHDIPRIRFKYYLPPESKLHRAKGRNCQVCGIIFPDAQKLCAHLKYHPEFAYFCWVCPRNHSVSLGGVTEIARHVIQDHFNKAQNPCPLCRQNMSNRPLPHILYECNHNLICQLCRDFPMFDSEFELQAHRERCHYSALRRFECSRCGKYYSTTGDFRRHACDMTQVKMRCDCGVELATKILYDQHFMANHLRGDICKICNKAHANMYRHRDTHAKPAKLDDMRHLLMCAYGKVNNEEKSILVAVSNTSVRMKEANKLANGGTEDKPLQLSDDDEVVDLTSPDKPVKRGQQQLQQGLGSAAASPAGASTPDTKNRSRTTSGTGVDAVEGDAAVVESMVRKMVRQVSKRENNAAEQQEEKKIEPVSEEEKKEEETAAMDDDDDVCILIDEPTNKEKGGESLLATVREEQEDNTVGGQGQPGVEDDEETDTASPPTQPTVRQFEPDDDELCVVGEVENAGCSSSAQAISNQREKKFSCDKCSQKFMTNKSFEDHRRKEHVYDAGTTTLSVELGIPLNKAIYICKNCCIAFPTLDMQRAHRLQHGGQRTLSCDTCSGSAYNMTVMQHHQTRVAERKVMYMCGECHIDFDHETHLHEHSSTHHGVRLFYFCKSCDLGSTDGDTIYAHYMTECRAGYAYTKTGRNGVKGEEQASRNIGVCPASQLHYQPQNVALYKQSIVSEQHKYVQPSLCNHRSLLCAVDRMVSCDDCKCLVNIATYAAHKQLKTNAPFDDRAPVKKNLPPPLYSLKAAYHNARSKQPSAGARLNAAETQLQSVRAASSPSAASYNTIARPQQQPAPSVPYVPSQNVMVTPGQQHPPTLRQQQHPQLHQMLHSQPLQMQQGQGHNLGGGLRFPVGVIPQGAAVSRGRVASPYNSMQNLNEAQQRRSDVLQAFTVARGNGVMGRPPQYPTGQMGHHDARVMGQFPPSRAPRELSTLTSMQSLVPTSAAAAAAAASSSAESTPSPSSRQCKVCLAPLLSARDQALHSMHHSSNSIICQSCPTPFKGEKNLIAHIIDHLTKQQRSYDMDLQCPVPSCSVELPTLIALRRHMSCCHSPPLTYRTPCCNLMFKTKELAEAHDNAHMASTRPEEMQCCILCGTVDNWTYEMVDLNHVGHTISHLIVHALDFNCYCKICLTKHDDVNALVTHYIMNHTDEEGDIRSCFECENTPLATEAAMKKHCTEKHMITEYKVPNKLMVKVPLDVMREHFGITDDD